MKSENPDLGEQALSKVAELGISSQLDEAENVNVDIRTDPGNLVQGKLGSVEVSGQGLVMKQDLRVDTLRVNIGEVTINPLGAVFGNIELTRPTDADAQISLTEADINRALGSSFVKEKLQSLEIKFDGRPEKVSVQQAELSLPGENQFVLDAEFLIGEQTEVKKLMATAIPKIQENGNQIFLEVVSAEGEGLTKELIDIIFDHLTALLDLRNFDLSGMSLQLQQLDAKQGKVVIHAKTRIDRFPSTSLP
jgi:phosphoribosyl-ATP pyrophosphohydrolase